ncbi:MAG: SCP2 sterol-binding domain-containing protein [Acidimicrobiales bacterium]
MGVFKDTAEAEKFLGGIWEKIGEDPDLGPKLEAADIIMRGAYEDPVATVTITCKPGGISVECGETATEPDATLIMPADMGNRFWLGAVNLPMALARGQIKAEGKMSDIMKLLPLLKPAFQIYREFLKVEGREELLTK